MKVNNIGLLWGGGIWSNNIRKMGGGGGLSMWDHKRARVRSFHVSKQFSDRRSPWSKPARRAFVSDWGGLLF